MLEIDRPKENAILFKVYIYKYIQETKEQSAIQRH